MLQKDLGKIKKLGQFFTEDKKLQKCLFRLIRNKPKTILEPSCGQGHLVRYINRKIITKWVLIEIDKELENISGETVINENFLTINLTLRFETIIGNPPYVKYQGTNLYLLFIEKCLDLLEPFGELIFIVPSTFGKTSSSRKVVEKMVSMGSFTDFQYFDNENLFKNATVSVCIFRYVKGIRLRYVCLNGVNTKLVFHKGLITEKRKSVQYSVSNFFDIYVGMVSGKESVFKNEKYGNISVRNGKTAFDKYILIKKFPSNNQEVDNYLLENKQELLARRIRKFNETNWFEWGALRNVKAITKNLGKPCIFVHTLTRQPKIAFVGKVEYFGGGLLLMIPKKETINLKAVKKLLNSENFQKNFRNNGRFKIGQSQLKDCLISEC